MKADVPRGGTHVHLIVTARYLPRIDADIPIGQRTRRSVRVQHDAHFPGFAWLQFYSYPAYQPFRRLARTDRQAKIDLRDLSTRPFTDILDFKAHTYRPGAIGGFRFNLELRIREGRVGKPVAKRKEWLDS